MAIKKKVVESSYINNSNYMDNEKNCAGNCGSGNCGGACSSGCCDKSNVWHLSFGKQILWTLVGVLLVYLIFYVGVLTRNDIKKFFYVGMADQMERTISVAGYGKVTGSNDIAVTSVGYSNVDSDVAKAQLANKVIMDQVMAGLKKLNIADNDLQSDYSIYPEYNYTQDKGQVLKGYRVTNNVTVKVRNLTNIPAVLSLAGQYGANQVGNLTFTIDDPNNLKAAARTKAVKDAEEKAIALANQLGVRLVEVVSYNEYDAGPVYPPYTMAKSGLGMGGAVDMAAPAVVASGSQDVAMNVNVMYKIVPR